MEIVAVCSKVGVQESDGFVAVWVRVTVADLVIVNSWVGVGSLPEKVSVTDRVPLDFDFETVGDLVSVACDRLTEILFVKMVRDSELNEDNDAVFLERDRFVTVTACVEEIIESVSVRDFVGVRVAVTVSEIVEVCR